MKEYGGFQREMAVKGKTAADQGIWEHLQNF